MNAADWITLAAASLLAAGALLLEHYTCGRRHWPRQVYYALGLVTDLGILLGWAVLSRLLVDPLAAVAILTAGALAGVPVALLLHTEQAAERARWAALVRHDRALAQQLALLQITGTHRYSRTHQLVESVSFIQGGLRQDLDDLRTLVDQLDPLLRGLVPPDAETKEAR